MCSGTRRCVQGPAVQKWLLSLQMETLYSPSGCLLAVCTDTLYCVRGLRNQWPRTVIGRGTARATSLVGTSWGTEHKQKQRMKEGGSGSCPGSLKRALAKRCYDAGYQLGNSSQGLQSNTPKNQLLSSNPIVYPLTSE